MTSTFCNTKGSKELNIILKNYFFVGDILNDNLRNLINIVLTSKNVPLN